MKSIFMGDERQIAKVYPKETILQLEQEAALDASRVYTAENWNADPAVLADVDYIFTTWGMLPLTEEEIATYLPNLKAVFYSAGSVQFFARPFLNRGIRVFSAWGANAVPVAEFALAEIILANTGFFQAHHMHSKADRGTTAAYTHTFPGNYACKVGIIGAGMIGRMVVERLKKDYHLDVLVFDPFLPDEAAAQLGVRKCSLTELFTECQTISNHLANNPQTVGMLNYETCFSHMKANATFINTGRGAQVVEEDLIRALKESPARTAVLDVTFPEPPEDDSEFYTLPNVILTPHAAGSKGQEVWRMSLYMLEEFRRMTGTGECAPKYEVSLKMLETMA